MKVYDISMEIREGMTVYKNKEGKKFKFVATGSLENGANESKLYIESHTGTHADAYFHMLAKGKTMEKMDVGKFIGDCVVLDFSNKKDKITVEDLSTKKISSSIKKNDIVILKTMKKPLKKWDGNYTYLDKTGAKYLAGKKVKCVGVENLSIERNSPNHDTHKILFNKDIPIIEGLEVCNVKAGRYFFVGLPLKIKGGDGSPIRAVLVEK
jgi:arylformamidase|tara:strand:- start:63 stop:692 length:630 start_codon:yes stop_codon:yes gene_type:complete